MALITTTAAPAVTPTSAPLPPATQVTINNGAGDQTDPHVSGDIAAYTSDVAGTTQTQIRYYNFATAADKQQPGGEYVNIPRNDTWSCLRTR